MENFINLLCLLFGISEFILFVVKRSKEGSVKVRKDRGSAALIWTSALLGIFSSIYVNSYFSSGQLPEFKIILGSLVLIAGLGIRWTAILQLAKAFTVDVSLSKDHELKQTGLYKSIRHPSYLGLLLAFLGLSLLFRSWLPLLLINAPVFLALSYRINIEEALLTEAFGQKYLDYKSGTKKIIPGIY